MTKNDGGPAFACISVDPSGDVFHQTGMTLRQWYIGQALAGLCANTDITNDEYAAVAEMAIGHADSVIEMLKAREGEG